MDEIEGQVVMGTEVKAEVKTKAAFADVVVVVIVMAVEQVLEVATEHEERHVLERLKRDQIAYQTHTVNISQ